MGDPASLTPSSNTQGFGASQHGPAAEERERYLVHRASCDEVAPAALLRIARETLAVARQIDISHRGSVTPGDFTAAAQRWAMEQLRKGGLLCGVEIADLTC
jgi:hypothetical protein